MSCATTSGKGTLHARNPLKISRHRHPPPIPGEQSVIMQNWRPRPKMAGPVGIQALHWRVPKQGGPITPPPPIPPTVPPPISAGVTAVLPTPAPPDNDL